MNIFIQPLLNPIPFFKQTPDENPQYATKYFDAWPFEETIDPWEQYTEYHIPFQTNDSIRLQFQANYAPIKAVLISDEGREYDLGNLDPVRRNADDPDLYIYQADFALNAYPEDCYRLYLKVGTPVSLTLVSPWLNIREKHPHSVLLDYKHYQFKDDVIFETGFSPVKRVFGKIRYKSPARKDTLFEDQPLNLSLVRSRHWRLWELSASSVFGIPQFEIDILDRVFGCSDVQIEGRYFTVSESKWELTTEDDYPMIGAKIELREKLNKTAKRYEDEVLQALKYSVVINVDSRGFGPDDAGGSIYQITDIQ